MIEPISVCELDDGSPKYQVARFHTIAAISSANTIANPAPLPTCRISSTGSNCRIPNATAPLETITPRKFHMPDQITATFGVSECVDHGRDRVRRIVKAVHELEAERDQQRRAEHQVRNSEPSRTGARSANKWVAM